MDAASTVITLTEETGGAAPFNGLLSHDDNFAWRDDSGGVWTSRQERMQPAGGWALGPVRPVFVQQNGEVTRLPDLTHAAGPLDALIWLGGSGVALAQFGARGDYYRPEHPDPAPTLAFVDAAKGRILDTLAYSDFPGHGLPNASYQASGIILPDGRPRALLTFNNRWIVWTANEPPRSFAAPYPYGYRRADLSPDGNAVLVSLELPTTTVCPRIPPCRIGPPVSGPVAALHDIRTGRRLWSLSGTAVYGTVIARPVFSPDARLLLIGMPPVDGKAEISVLDARTGRSLQTVGAPAGGSYSMGFTADGRHVWVSVAGITFFYEVRSSRG